MKKILAILILFVFVSPSNSRNLDDLEEIIEIIVSDQTAKKERVVPLRKTGLIKKNKKIEKPKKKKEKKITLTPPSPDEALLRSGLQLFNASLFEKAKKKFETLKREFPESPYRDSASIWISRIHMKSNRYDDAIDELRTIGPQSGEYPTALFNIGETQIKKGRQEGAIEFFYKISSEFPDHELADDALIMLCRLYLNLNKGKEAMESAIKIIKHYKGKETEDDAYFFLGKIFERDTELRDFGIARKIYKIFLEKAESGELPYFQHSPLKERVKRDLRFLEYTYFKMEH